MSSDDRCRSPEAHRPRPARCGRVVAADRDRVAILVHVVAWTNPEALDPGGDPGSSDDHGQPRVVRAADIEGEDLLADRQRRVEVGRPSATGDIGGVMLGDVGVAATLCPGEVDDLVRAVELMGGLPVAMDEAKHGVGELWLLAAETRIAARSRRHGNVEEERPGERIRVAAEDDRSERLAPDIERARLTPATGRASGRPKASPERIEEPCEFAFELANALALVGVRARERARQRDQEAVEDGRGARDIGACRTCPDEIEERADDSGGRGVGGPNAIDEEGPR